MRFLSGLQGLKDSFILTFLASGTIKIPPFFFQIEKQRVLCYSNNGYILCTGRLCCKVYRSIRKHVSDLDHGSTLRNIIALAVICFWVLANHAVERYLSIHQFFILILYTGSCGAGASTSCQWARSDIHLDRCLLHTHRPHTDLNQNISSLKWQG